MKKLIYIFIFFTVLLFLSSCSWSPIIVKNGQFIPAETLKNKSLEIGIQSYAYIPSNLSLGYGFTDNMEFKLNFGYSGNVYNADLGVYYQLIKNDTFLLSGFALENIYFEPENNFFTVISSLGIIPGFKFWNSLTLYTPLNVNYLTGGSWGTGFGVTAGLGINYSFKNFRISVETNYSIPTDYKKITIIPFVGAGLFYNF